MTTIAQSRSFYAKLMAAQAHPADPRLEEVFAAVPREAFLGPGPWTIVAGKGVIETPSADPRFIYQNVLVVLDADKGINNGEPFLHAMWIGKLAPRPGEAVTHIGAGTGYYTALLARLVSPSGTVAAFELTPILPRGQRQTLRPTRMSLSFLAMPSHRTCRHRMPSMSMPASRHLHPAGSRR